MLCEYGCGREAIHLSKSSRRDGPFKGRPVYICGKSSNSCPAVKESKKQASLEKYGVDNPMKDPAIAQKMADNTDYQLRNETTKKTLQEKYGVNNNFQREDVKAKIAEGMASQTPEAMAKKRATRIKNGFEIPPEQKTEFARYRALVDTVTRKHLRENRDKIEDGHLEIGRTRHHTDHVFSVYDGFVNGVEPEVVGHWCNLKLLPYHENCAKSIRSDMTLTELRKRYGMFCSR
jgi:hypothetical protein